MSRKPGKEVAVEGDNDNIKGMRKKNQHRKLPRIACGKLIAFRLHCYVPPMVGTLSDSAIRPSVCLSVPKASWLHRGHGPVKPSAGDDIVSPHDTLLFTMKMSALLHLTIIKLCSHGRRHFMMMICQPLQCKHSLTPIDVLSSSFSSANVSRA